MDELVRAGFVQRDTLSFTPVSGGFILEGEIACLGEIVITVLKFIDVVEDGERDDLADALVQTREYNYNASVRGHGNILRHDNAHPHPKHADDHHVHEYDWKTNKQLPGSPKWVGAQGWPSLAQFIRTVHDWYCAHRDELPNPEGVPELGLRASGGSSADE